MQRFISFSGGVESTAMCILYGENAKAITADTGWEHPEMYERWTIVEERIKQIHPCFEVIKVRNERETLVEKIRRQKFFPGIRARYCTSDFKIKPIDDFLSRQGKCELMIGLNSDEFNRTGNHGLKKNVTYSYPLIDNGMSRAACTALLKKFDLNPVFPPYMTRGGCVGCFFKSRKEFEAMYLIAPEQFNEVERMERETQDKRVDYYGISTGFSLKDIKRKLDANPLIFSPSEIYDVEHIQTPCGVFCHR